MTFDAKTLREAFGAYPTGVTVVTTRDGDGRRYGFTANSFTSVSLEPPLLLVCPGRFLSSYAAFERCERFAVSVLAEGQEDVSNIFARFKGDRFAEIAWREDAGGVPLIEGAAACFSCRTARAEPAGDHLLLLGRIEAFERSGARGLGYAQGAYFSLSLEREAAAPAPQGRPAFVGAIVGRPGAVLLEETADGLRPPHLALKGRAGAREALAAHLAAAGLTVRLGEAYSIFDERGGGAHYTYFLAEAADAATGGLGAYRPIETFGETRFVTPAHGAMLARYAADQATRDFALYVGDERAGDLHPIAARS